MISNAQDVEHKKKVFRQYSDKVIVVQLKYVLLILTRTI